MGLDNPLHLAFLLILVALWLVPSWLVAMYAERKGQPFWAFFVIGIFASWILALIIALVIKDRRESRPASANDDLDRLERLAALRDKGALTAEEFEAEKANLLAP